ncbi:hypothetical protein Rhopal_002820-T1 [Rhodotorula paludigena]|uniref:glycogenin glucosyltransferase n=1 Tax=Rhodotorula paludigena TaxID=86838 RepID=A0AAV5GK08_9BASI|nr:hypothetical protein Rhopal_002820-T1 [Rhodotorula paludigena]
MDEGRAELAFVTLVTSDQYLPGALVTLHSLLDVEDTRSRAFATVCLATPATLSHATVQALGKAFDVVIGVEPIVSESIDELKLLGRLDLAASLTKLHLFRLTQFRKVVFLDADTLVLRPLSHLFNTPARFAAAPDQGWPDAFNSGVFVAEPSLETFGALVDMMRERGSWDGGDQGLLNDYFDDWHRLSFTYNVTPSAFYTYAPAYRRHGQGVSVLHFIGADKPWNRGTRVAYDPNSAARDYLGLVNQWYDVFERHYGSGSTYDVGDRVTVPEKSFLRKEFSTLPLLPKYSKPSLAPPPAPASASQSALPPPVASDAAAPPFPPTPTISIAPASPARDSTATPVAIPAPRTPSPPQLTWDPSRSSPPRDGPFQMRDAIPSSSNVWDDDVPRSQQRQRFEPPQRYPEPPRETHDWYRDVMREKPDPSKVKPVFPWEVAAAAPAAATSREPSPPLALGAGVPPPLRTFSDDPAQAGGAGTPPARFGVQYGNAWDSIPAISRYAQQLAKRHTGHGRKPSSGGGGSGSASSSGEKKGGGHRRTRSGGSASGREGASTPRARHAGHGIAQGGSRAGVGASPRPDSLFSKDGDASSRDGDDEDDEDADASAATGDDEGDNDDDDDDDETERYDEDSEEGVDRIAIRFRRALSGGELDPTNRRGKKSGSPSSNEDTSNGAFGYSSSTVPKSPRDAPSIPTSPTKTRRDSRWVPTSPRQARSPQLTSSAHSPLLSAPVSASGAGGSTSPKPSLRLHLPGSPAQTALSPRLAAQALRNSTAARLTSSGAGSGDGPPVVRATRVFSPETDTGAVKQRGLAALQRFVENMELAQQQQQHMQIPEQDPHAGYGGAPGGGAGSAGSFRW